MKYNILTSFNEKYWNELAKETTRELDNNWLDQNIIYLYHELSYISKDIKYSDRVQWIDLYKNCPELLDFKNKWKNEPKANGGDGKGGNFRIDAIKFSHKTYAIWHACRNNDSGWMIWLDCDAFVYKKIDNSFIEKIFPNDKMICYLGRPGKYSECGFLGFNLDHPECRNFLKDWESLYQSGDIFKLSETHDSYTFDYIRKLWNKPEIFLNLNTEAKTNKNPFGQSQIGPWIMHSKGKDKNYQFNRFKNRHLE
jgi:hypothetical protein